MIAALKEKAIVQRGGLLEIRSASLPPPGTVAEVLVLFDQEAAEEPAVPLASLIGSARGLYRTPDDADAYRNGERDSWGS